MGFPRMFGLVDRQLHRELYFWLATRVDVLSYCLINPDGLEFTVDPVQVHWVLGIPKGYLPVPKEAMDDATKQFLEGVLSQFSTTTPSNMNGIPRKNLVQAVESPLEDVFEFKVAFLLLALVDVPCPTTSHRLYPKLLPAAIAAVDPESYDWCSLVLEKTYVFCFKLCKEVLPYGMMYLYRLRRPPVKRGVFPRLKVWTEAEIDKAKNADRIMDGDFGKLGVVEVLMKVVDVEEEDVVDELISTQGVKKRPREGPGYFGWSKSSGMQT
uniref:Uncharacterized protein n=1 Tax=Chenopodium quinoa TaxID=63459 RepID=A0A803NA55_CHEQI